MSSDKLRDGLNNADFDQRLRHVYALPFEQLAPIRSRFVALLDDFDVSFPGGASALFSAPGRTEIGGNHTDHQGGSVLAGSVSLDMIAAGAINASDPSATNQIFVRSLGHKAVCVSLNNLEPNPDEFGTSAALVRGVARGFVDRGYTLDGANIVIHSTIPNGVGVSSSAAFEVLISVILNYLFCHNELSAVQLAQIGHFAETVFFGKPCGLMDQLACSVGGIIHIDLFDAEHPVITPIDADIRAEGYALCLIDSGVDHADLTDEYAEITKDMAAVSKFFGQATLSCVSEADFWHSLSQVQAAVGGRAVLRAIHFFEDTKRVSDQAHALEQGRTQDFLKLVTRSGVSSATQLQNLYSLSTPKQQQIGVCIALAQKLLHGRGAVRIHGGGFAGAIQAYVPIDQVDSFKTEMEAVLGQGTCHLVEIRQVGGTVIAST